MDCFSVVLPESNSKRVVPNGLSYWSVRQLSSRKLQAPQVLQILRLAAPCSLELQTLWALGTDPML